MSTRTKLNLKNILYGVLALSLGSMTVAGQDLFGRSKKLFDKGLELKRKGNYAGAAENFGKIIKKYPKSDVIQTTYYEYGAVLFKEYEWQYWKTAGLQKYFEALESFRQVNTSDDSLLAKSLYMQARCFRKIHYRPAMAFYDSVTVLFPSHHLADDALFLSAYIDPNLPNSLAKYHQLRSQYPDSEHDLGALYHLLQIYRTTGDYIKSNTLCTEFIELYPDSYYTQSIFLYYVSNLLMSGEQSEAVKYVQKKAKEKQQLWEQIPKEYVDLSDNELRRKAWNLRYEKDSTSQDNRKIIQSYLDTKITLNKAITILDFAIPKRSQPVLDNVDSLFFTTGVFQEYHVSYALERARENLRNRNYVQAANISMDLVNNPLVRDPSEAYWILGQIYPRFYLPSYSLQVLRIAKPGLILQEDRMACLERLTDNTHD
ncbi:MAG TPA: tetratricopeptide repeat protein, partial [Candidatus Marinimicrobia bacterium]|nr:tetratricopeptide repeat protein [Candidatus Neomarinimicrobiota bacterium]